jgi:cytochrome c
MKFIFGLISVLAVFICLCSSAIGAGDVERGRALFNDPDAFGGVRACSACHPDGSGLSEAGGKKEFHVAGGVQESLEEAVNACIKYASRGKPIETDSAQMQDIVAYIKSLGK